MVSAISFYFIRYHVIQKGSVIYETPYVKIIEVNDNSNQYWNNTFKDKIGNIGCNYIEEIGENKTYIAMKYERKKEYSTLDLEFNGEWCESFRGGYTIINKKTLNHIELDSEEGRLFIKKEKIWMLYNLDFMFIKLFIRDRKIEKMETLRY